MSEWRALKEVTLSSGRTAIIRKLRQLDFAQGGLVDLVLGDVLGDGRGVTEEQQRRYLREHLREVLDFMDVIVVRGTVSPELTLDPADKSRIYVLDVDPQDRDELFRAIQEWSGLTPAQEAADRGFRGEVGSAAGGSGETLREDPDGAAPAAD